MMTARDHHKLHFRQVLKSQIDLIWITECRLIDMRIVTGAISMRCSGDISLFESDNDWYTESIERLMPDRYQIKNTKRP